MTIPLYSLRQSAASLFAMALLELFPDALLLGSDVSQVDFSYTFYLEQPLEEGIMTLFEEKMRTLVKEDLAIEATEMMRENAVVFFEHLGQSFMAELIEEAEENIVPVLKIGEFYDFAAPPYVSSTKELNALKLQKLIQVEGKEHTFCIHGTVFPDQKSLKQFLKRVEVAKKCDHRRLGPELQLFAHVGEAGKEGWFWLPKGAFLREMLLDWWRAAHQAQGFQPVATPPLVQARYNSGKKKDEHELSLPDALEPLHAQLFRLQIHSYRELPVRYAEASVVRAKNNSPGCGLLSVQAPYVDRAHFFCSPQEVSNIVISSLQFIEKTVNILGFEYQWNLSSRGAKFAGTKESWDKVLGWMKDALHHCNCSYSMDAEMLAFNGPRLVVRMKDALGREWDGPFVAVDFFQPERFGLRYQGADGGMHSPFMITRSMFGSLERFIAILVESCAGNFPLWLAPEQVRVLPITDAHRTYAEEVCMMMGEAGLRCSVDCRPEPLGAKVHAVEREKIPYAIIVGDAEKKDSVINVRSSSRHSRPERMEASQFLQRVQEEVSMPKPFLKDT